MNKFKPMLSANETIDLDKIKYPKLASGKLDGVRFIVHPDLGMVTRSLKQIPNIKIREKFQPILDIAKRHNIILDGEIYSHKLTFQEIISVVMTHDTTKNVDKVKFHCFECCNDNFKNAPFIKRCSMINALLKSKIDLVKIVEQKEVNSKEEVIQLYRHALSHNYEGLILRDPNSPYKFGRSTLKQEWMLKLKPFKTFDAHIIGVEERMENLNESFRNELGQSTKRNTVDAKEPTGIAAKFIVNYGNEEVKPTITGTEEFRREIWKNRKSYIGRMIEYKGMLVGAKDVPRHPTFLRFRTDRPVKKPKVKNESLNKWM